MKTAIVRGTGQIGLGLALRWTMVGSTWSNTSRRLKQCRFRLSREWAMGWHMPRV